MPRTVRDFKNFVLPANGNSFSGEFCRTSEEHHAFWEKLNRLGARNMGKIPPEIVPDIDATVELSDREWAELTAEFQELESQMILG